MQKKPKTIRVKPKKKAKPVTKKATITMAQATKAVRAHQAKAKRPMTMMEVADTLGIHYTAAKRGREAIDAAWSQIGNSSVFWDEYGDTPVASLVKQLLTYIDELHRASFDEDRWAVFKATRQFSENGK